MQHLIIHGGLGSNGLNYPTDATHHEEHEGHEEKLN
jgi:hypothetical protein